MDYRNHLKSGALLGVVAIDRLYEGNLANLTQLGLLGLGSFALGLSLGSGLPDIDHHKSLIAQKLKAIGWVISRFFSHRGFTHSVAFVISVYICFMFGEKYVPSEYSLSYRYFAFGTVFGSSAHILMDMFIGNGVRLFAPISQRKFSFLKIRSGSKAEATFHKFLLFLFVVYLIFRTSLGGELLSLLGSISLLAN